MKYFLSIIIALTLAFPLKAADGGRALWASINSDKSASTPNSVLGVYNNIILVSWRMLPTDDANTAFDLYRSTAGGKEVKLNVSPMKNATCWQILTAATLSADVTSSVRLLSNAWASRRNSAVQSSTL